MTPQEIVNYYANLLIFQYVGKPRAYAMIQALANIAIIPDVTVQEIDFQTAPTSGTFVLNYGALFTAAINWNDSVSVIQGKLQALSGLASVTVSGSIASQSLVVTFTGVAPITTLLTISANSLQTSGVAVTPTVVETDVTLPFAVQNAYNIDTAVGVQLDVLGKYVGVTRYGYTFTGPITLDDDEFRVLIKVEIINNSNGSSLADIQNLLHMFFPGTLLVFDFQDMHMDYFFDSSIGSRQLAEVFVQQGVLPKPMGVELGALIYSPDIDSFFGFRTYPVGPYNVSGFNTYDSYSMSSPWLSYSDAIAF